MLTDNAGIPFETFHSLREYVINHRAPGGFLTAVLSNSLMDAVLRANCECLEALPEICNYIYTELPGDCWGSSEAVENWISVPNTNENENENELHLVTH